MATQLPAVVTIQDLPAATTVTLAELIEAVQTSGGVAQSVQIPLSQIVTPSLGALPTGGAAGQVLSKSSGSNFATGWSNISSLVTPSTGLASAGSTTVALSLASVAGLSVLAVAAAASAVPAVLAGAAAQVLRVNDAGNALAFGAINLASSAAVTGVLPGANMSAVNLSTSGAAGGVQNVLQAANITAINVGATGAGGIQGQPKFLPATALPVAGSSTVGIQISSAANLGFYVGSGTPTFTAGTSSLYLNFGAVTATSRLYINTNGTGGWANFTASA